jgi:hypothetical protein
MRIALNLLYLIPGRVGGTERYATALIDEMAQLAPRHRFRLYLSAEAARMPLPSWPNVERVPGPLPATRRGLRYAWEQLALPLQLAKDGVDLVHSLGYVCPLAARGPQVVTICDANYLAIRQLMSGTKRAIVPWFIRQSARRARHVLTLSQFAADEIAADTGISPEKITVTHLAGRG